VRRKRTPKNNRASKDSSEVGLSRKLIANAERPQAQEGFVGFRPSSEKRGLEPEQLRFADKIAKVKSVGFYHGGDELYELKGVPGMWHEQCLRAVEQVGFFRRLFKY
jgi:hypothetical protein